MLSLAGKVAIVSGAGSVGPGWGNGKATATLLARQGAAVFATDIKREAVEETRKIIEAEANTCVAHVCDAANSADVKAAVDACLARFGHVDILVNNVGGSAPGGPVEMSEETFDLQLTNNLKTAFLGCKHVLPVMEGQGKGAIVNIASVAGLRDHVGRTHVGYSASKAGVIQLSRATAVKYAPKNIRINTVVPGLMNTPLVTHRLARQIGNNDAEALIADRHKRVPMGHMGDAWDVAHAVLFLASDEARYITATEIVVDGGMIATIP
ncbi:MAG: SDR family oxidoreductase [Acetobacteraceae bacterium]|nr:SDR family oxidoreductase [Acetobacteraceae bacterium]